MNRCAFISLALHLAASQVPAQEAVRPEAVTFIATEEAASKVRKCVFAVFMATSHTNLANINDWTHLGTGFFAGRSNATFGVTCAHIVNTASRARKDLFMGFDTTAGYKRIPARPFFISTNLDFAFIESELTNQIAIQGWHFGTDHFDDGRSIVEGRGVLIVGYPLELGTEQNRNLPVVRFGMVAQQTPTTQFLVDGIASHGNSGSPVVSLGPREFRLIGMTIGNKPDQITLFNEMGGISAFLPYNSGLAVVLKSSVILEAIPASYKQ